MKICADNFETTLAAVRELSERAMLRPAPRVVRCVPFREYTAPRAPAPEPANELINRLLARRSAAAI